MFKSCLNEYCQSMAWILPEYRIKREGPDHCPRWKGLVVVNDQTFISPDFCKSSKEAQNVAAKLALEHFSGSTNVCMTRASMSASIQLPESQENSSDNNMLKDVRHKYKHQLQIYAQKRNLELPVYSVDRVGPFHSCLFKPKVTIAGKTYESGESFHTLKEAENAAAKVALDSVNPEPTQKDDLFMYKNLLQESLQKEYSGLPKYTTVQAGQPHIPVFLSTVEIQGETFRGQEAKTKKQAEMNAAKVAYIALTEHAGKVKKDDKQNVVGATTHTMETPKTSSANIPVVGATASSKTVRSNAQSMPEKQIRTVEDIGLEATPNAFKRTHGAATTCGTTGNLKATPSFPEPTYYPKTPPTSVLKSQPVGGSRSDNQIMKTKKVILPWSSSSSSEDVKPVIHIQKDLNIPPQRPLMRATTTNLGQSATPPDASVCALHSNKKWIPLVPKEEPSA